MLFDSNACQTSPIFCYFLSGVIWSLLKLIYMYTYGRDFYPKKLALHSTFCFFVNSFPGYWTHDLGVSRAMIFRSSYNQTLSGKGRLMICSVDLWTRFLDRSFINDNMFFLFIMLSTHRPENLLLVQSGVHINCHSFRYLAGVIVCAMACFFNCFNSEMANCDRHTKMSINK